jgi:hypothetical protein
MTIPEGWQPARLVNAHKHPNDIRDEEQTHLLETSIVPVRPYTPNAWELNAVLSRGCTCNTFYQADISALGFPYESTIVVCELEVLTD